MSKTWGFFLGGSGHDPESSCQISAYYKFFPGKSYFYRTIMSFLSFLLCLHSLKTYCSAFEFFFSRSYVIFLPFFFFAAANTLLTFFFIAQYCSFDCWSFFFCHTLYKRLFSLMTSFTSSFYHNAVF